MPSPSTTHDVIVHTETSFHCFEDLRGRTWAYNERGSHSGFNIVRYHLAMRGFDKNFFCRIVDSGSHRNSLQMILQRSIDTAAIDSSVLSNSIRFTNLILVVIRHRCEPEHSTGLQNSSALRMFVH
jgi:ABC-type phosphate/phosphonate transport system substrate-binding protein